LFNALNIPSTLSPYNANGDFTVVPNTTGLEMKLSIHWRKLPIRITITISKKLNGNFGLEYKLVDGLVLSSSMGFNSSNSKSRDLQNKSVTEEKYLMLLEVLLLKVQ
jgi:hypothetical protein